MPFKDMEVQSPCICHVHHTLRNSLNITTSRRFKCVFLKWLIPLDVVAWRLSLFLWASLSVASESVSNNFGFIRLEKGEIFWKETSKDWNNAAIKGPWANWLVNESFCLRRVNDYKVIRSNHCRHFINLASSQCIFKFCKLKLVYFGIQIISRALKRDLERVVLVTERQN